MGSTHADSSVARWINGERLVVLGWPRAIVMQVAHPLVAAGVADHSSFRQGGVAAVTRLRHTIRAMRRLTCGDQTARDESLARIRAIHRRVHGRLAAGVGPFPAGTPYSAEDPALVLWVHLTLLDSLPRLYDLVVEPLSESKRDTFCGEAAETAVLLGAHDADVPRSWSALQRALAETLASGAIVVGDQARDLARAVLRPRLGFVASPAIALTRLLSIGTLPDVVRQAYGWSWTTRDERRLRRAVRLLRVGRRFAPECVARWPEARRGAPRI